MYIWPMAMLYPARSVYHNLTVTQNVWLRAIMIAYSISLINEYWHVPTGFDFIEDPRTSNSKWSCFLKTT